MFLYVLGRWRGADSYRGEAVDLPSGALDALLGQSPGGGDGATGCTAAGRGCCAGSARRPERIAADAAVGHGRHVVVLAIHVGRLVLPFDAAVPVFHYNLLSFRYQSSDAAWLRGANRQFSFFFVLRLRRFRAFRSFDATAVGQSEMTKETTSCVSAHEFLCMFLSDDPTNVHI